MKEHEIFQVGEYNEIDGIVLTDKVYEEVEYMFYASYIESLEDAKSKNLMLDITSVRGSSCMFLDKSEIDALIGFLTFVRNKMG